MLHLTKKYSIGITMLALALTANIGKSEDSETKINLRVKVDGCRNNKGEIRASLFKDEKGYPRDDEQIYRKSRARVEKNSATVVFEELLPGIYALVLFQDENMNGKVDRNFIGIPKEGVGFSNNERAKFAPPSFKDCKFEFSRAKPEISIQLVYY